MMEAEFSILSLAHAGGDIVPIGILLLNGQELVIRCRQDWDNVADADDLELLTALAEDLVQRGRELGAVKLLDYLEDTLSNWLRISDRQRIETKNLDEEIDRLYNLYVGADAQPRD
jgi:hypothetical protein